MNVPPEGPKWTTIQFDGGDDNVLRKMQDGVFSNFRNRSINERCPAKSISAVELAWDIPFPDFGDENICEILKTIAKYLASQAHFRACF